jgi:hypothetical protein
MYLVPGKENERRRLLDALMRSADSGSTFSTIVAAIINETYTALECLRRCPGGAAEILRECSIGAMAVVRPGFLGQRLLDNRANRGPPQDVIAIHAVSAAASAVQGRGALTVVNVHICGECYAGKSMTRKALLKSVNSSPAIRLFSSELPDIALEDGRTLGMASTLLETGGVLTKRVRVLIQDYGGQEAFRVNHASYLSAPNSVYLLVVPLWDMRPQQGSPSESVDKPMPLNYIVEKYSEWLKFINSVVPESAGKVQCITVLNFARRFQALPSNKKAYTVEKAVIRLKEVQEVFKASPQCRLEFVETPPIPVNSIVPASVQKRVVPELWKAIEALQEAPVPVSPIVQVVVNDLQVPGRWPLFCDECELQTKLQATIRDNLRLDPVLDSDPAVEDKVISTVAEIAQDRLQARGDIIVFNAQNATKSPGQQAESEKTSHRISINHPNWLSEQVLGDLFKPATFTDGTGVRDILLTHDRITDVSLPKGASLTPSQRQLLPKLLQHIGACLPVTYVDGAFRTIDTDAGAGDETPPQHYFPAFNVTRMDALHAVPWKDPVHVIVRVFKLKDPTTTVLPPGYFPALKVHIVSLYHGSNLIQLYQNGMALEMARGLRVIVRGGTDDTSFTLEVEVEADSSGECTVSAWEEMLKVRALVVKDAGWLKNVPLDEYGVHPKRRQAIARPISELALLAQAGKLCAEDEPFYFGAGRVDVMNRLKGIVEAGFARMDDKLDALAALAKTGFTTLSAHVAMSVEAAERAEAGNKVVLESLLRVLAKAPRDNDAHADDRDADVEAELWAERAQQFLSEQTARLQTAELTQADQLRGMKEELLGAFHAAVSQVQADTLKLLVEREAARSAEVKDALKQALTDELALLQGCVAEGREESRRALQLLAEKLNTTMPSDLHRELEHIRQELKAVRTVQDNTLYGVYDVPLLPIITHYEGKGVLDAVKGLAYESWTLHFACPVCAKPAASGPKGEGYKLQATHAWVRQVNKAVALGLKALSVISLVTPLPLPGLGTLADYLPTASLDALVSTAEGKLNTAQKQLKGLEKRVNTKAQTVGKLPNAAAAVSTAAADPAAALSPVRVDLDYVGTIREVLLALKETPPQLKHAGLVRAVCRDKGECAWVCKDSTCRALFEGKGVACQKINMEFA